MKLPRAAYTILLVCSIVLLGLVSPGYASSGMIWQDAFGRSLFSDRDRANSWEGALRWPAQPADQQVNAPAAPLGGLFKPYVAYSAEGAAYAVGVGDFNHDGLNDVAATGGGLRIYLQTDQGALQYTRTYACGAGNTNVAVGDFNSDGWDDVVVSASSSNLISVYLQKEDGALEEQHQYATNAGPDAVVVADFNNDGKHDIAVSHWTSANVGVFYQQSDGSLGTLVAYPAPQAGYDDIDAGDVNHDGLTDIVKMSGQGYANPSLSILYQKPTGGFDAPVSYDIGGSNLSNGVAVGDFTGDGRDDVAVSNGGNSPSAKLSVFIQDATGGLALNTTYQAYDIPESTEIADVNMDGLLDVLVVHGGWNRMGVFLQQENGALAAYQLYSLPYASHYQPQGFDLGDINNDRTPDAVIADYNHGVVVLFNATVPDFELQVTPALVTILPGNIAQWQLRLKRIWDFSEPVHLSVQGLPVGATYAFSENPRVPPGLVDLVVMVPPSAAAGVYQLTITGVAGDLQHSVAAQLKVMHAVTGLQAVNSSPSEFGAPVVLTATIATGTEVTYLWNFGDGKSAYGAVVTHNYSAPGQYFATVRAYNTLSAQNAGTLVVVTDKPISGLSIYYQSPSYANLLTRLFALIQQGTNVVFSWDFGDGAQGSGAIVDHRFGQPGIYLVKVTASNSVNEVSGAFEVTVTQPFVVAIPTLYQGSPPP